MDTIVTDSSPLQTTTPPHLTNPPPKERHSHTVKNAPKPHHKPTPKAFLMSFHSATLTYQMMKTKHLHVFNTYQKLPTNSGTHSKKLALLPRSPQAPPLKTFSVGKTRPTLPERKKRESTNILVPARKKLFTLAKPTAHAKPAGKSMSKR